MDPGVSDEYVDLMHTIPLYQDINAAHAATGYAGRTDLPDFHVFTLESTYPHTRQVMPPHRLDWYQVVLLEHSADATLRINAETVPELSNSISFASPAHVLAWVRGEQQRGYILYFKAAFLPQIEIETVFPYFRLDAVNWLQIISVEMAVLRDSFAHVLTYFKRDQPYRIQILQALLTALLYDLLRLYDAGQDRLRGQSAGQVLAIRFQQLVNQHFLTHRTVESYAEWLHISPDHLSATIKGMTGKTASSLIAERTALEARRLLALTDLKINEIATYLGYQEPTHFGRFFRRQVGVTPLEWRANQNQSPGNGSPFPGGGLAP